MVPLDRARLVADSFCSFLSYTLTTVEYHRLLFSVETAIAGAVADKGWEYFAKCKEEKEELYKKMGLLLDKIEVKGD